MDILIFIYNIFLIVLYTMVLTFCIINYRHKKRGCRLIPIFNL